MVINKTSRMTTQRLLILKYLKGVESHPTAETVYKAVKKNLPALTLATVYRNLNHLADHGMINRMEVNKEYRFDAELDTHLHKVCSSCGKITDIHDKDVEKVLSKSIDKHNASSFSVSFYGSCEGCK